MKKLLSALSATMIVASSASTVVSCGDKPMPSLSQNIIKDGDKALGYDITNWDASVIAASNIKDNFLSNLNKSFTTADQASTTSTEKLVETAAGDASTNIVAKTLADYEADASTDLNIKGLTVDNFNKDFNVTIYDNNNQDADKNATEIATWDGATSTWTDLKDVSIKEFTDKSGKYVYQTVNVISLFIEITPAKDNADKFVGAKANLAKDADTTGYYNADITGGSDAVKSQAALYSNNQFKAEKEHDYRYAVEFHFVAQ